MAETLTLKYEPDADVLVISKCPPYGGQETEDLGDLVIARRNPETRDIELLEILFFLERLRTGQVFGIPFEGDLMAVVTGLQLPMAAE